MKVVLASTSARRKELLKKIFPRFRIVPPRILEASPPSRVNSPYAYVQKMARFKAKAVSGRAGVALIIAADTVVWTGKKIVGKPRSARDAYRILKMLSGTRHSVVTGVCILDPVAGRFKTGYEETILRMARLSDDRIQGLVAQRKHLDKAGGYAIQESGDKYVKIVRGRLDNAVGLPLTLVRRLVSDYSDDSSNQRRDSAKG